LHVTDLELCGGRWVDGSFSRAILGIVSILCVIRTHLSQLLPSL
jgi:hypothetical protein